MKAMQSIFFHFMNQEFIYEDSMSDFILSKMSEKDKAIFPFDVRLINWKFCLEGFYYGIRRFFLKEDCLSPTEDSGFK
jgi:hypothetical protein